MTNEDEKRIADYMGWDGTTTVEGYAIPTPEIHHFDLNDAGLVVKEMVKRDDWTSFITFADNEHFDKEISVEFAAWLFNADNFFKTFVEWRKSL